MYGWGRGSGIFLDLCEKIFFLSTIPRGGLDPSQAEFLHLGVPVSGSKLHVADWLPICEKLMKRLGGWKGSSLRLGGWKGMPE